MISTGSLWRYWCRMGNVNYNSRAARYVTLSAAVVLIFRPNPRANPRANPYEVVPLKSADRSDLRTKSLTAQAMVIRRICRVVLITGLLLALGWFCTSRFSLASSQALTVTFLGYTNISNESIYSGAPGAKSYTSPVFSEDKLSARAAVFTISNTWNVEVRRWAVVYLEAAPFTATNRPTQWQMSNRSYTPDRYLGAHEAEQLFIVETPPGPEWRLRVPWSSGKRARIIDAARKLSKRAPFLRAQLWRVASEYYACSDRVTQ